MRSIRFHRAATLEEALAFKSEQGAEGLFVAGGTDLLVDLREESATLPPVSVLDIRGVGELQGPPALLGEEQIHLPPLMTHAEIAQSDEIRAWAPLLAEACAEVGSPQIRNRGTLGGNICNASPCADTVPPLVALEAELLLRSARQERRVPLEEAISAPYRTVLAADEILTGIRCRRVPPDCGSAFVKLGRRNALSVSRMSMAVILGCGSDGRLRDARIAAGSVTPTVKRFPEIEALLQGEQPSDQLFATAGRTLAQEMIRVSGQRWSTPYKEPVVAALLRRALRRAATRI